jgi:hypothetical protein
MPETPSSAREDRKATRPYPTMLRHHGASAASQVTPNPMTTVFSRQDHEVIVLLLDLAIEVLEVGAFDRDGHDTVEGPRFSCPEPLRDIEDGLTRLPADDRP